MSYGVGCATIPTGPPREGIITAHHGLLLGHHIVTICYIVGDLINEWMDMFTHMWILVIAPVGLQSAPVALTYLGPHNARIRGAPWEVKLGLPVIFPYYWH